MRSIKSTASRLLPTLAMSVSLLTVSAMSLSAHAQTCPFEDGNSSLAVEGLILTRYALGITGAPLVESTGISPADAPTVAASINCPSCGLNITGNAALTVADATIISRKLAGFSGAALTNGLDLGAGSRNTSAAVQSFLLAGCGATGGTVTSITAGLGLTGGTITGSGTIAVNPAVVQGRVSGSCAVGSSIRVIAADGTVTCQVDNGGTGGGGTVTSVATGSGLTGGPIIASGTIGLAATQLLPTVACASNQIPKWNGSAWLCATEAASGSGTVTSISAGSGLTGGTITGSGTIAADPTFLQRRVSASCAAGSSIRVIAADGTVTCQTDTGGGSGTVTSVATGAGLTGGPISSVGTINLAGTQLLPTTACATDQIAKWNGSAWVCAAPLPALPACMVGQVVRVGVGGVLQCGNLPNSIVTNRLGTDVIGQYSVIAVGSDGLPVVAYPNETTGQLYLLKCGNAACTSGNTNFLADPGTAGYLTPSVAVPADNLPVISYYDGNNSNLKVTKCGNAACSSGNTVTNVDSAGLVGSFTAIVVPPDGLPAIGYRDLSNASLKMVKCGNAACSNSNTISTIDTASPSDISIALGGDGFPVIAFYDVINTVLKVTKCADATCAVRTTVTVDSTAADVGKYTSITVPADGRPLISYFDETNDRLKVARCGNAACSAGNGLTVVDSSGIVGTYTSIAMGADGFAVVSYRDATNNALKFVKCGNITCGNNVNRIISTLDGGPGQSIGDEHSSVSVPADGLPVISYYHGNLQTLKIVKCSNAACVFP